MVKPPCIDLHVHSTFSDGKLPPDEVARLASLASVTALAITDHDTLAGYIEKNAACDRYGIECVNGVELSCHLDGREVHILSLFADPESPYTERVGDLGRAREHRMADMLDKLAGMGIRLNMEDLQVGEGKIFGRPHLARALVAMGRVKSVSEAFARFLYDDGPVHIPKVRLTIAEGIDLAQKLGGAAVLAHPGVSGLLNDLDTLVAAGLDGIEVYHPKHGGETIARLLRYCGERGLQVSGGSDFHSPGDGADIGSTRAPVELLARLRECAAGKG